VPRRALKPENLETYSKNREHEFRRRLIAARQVLNISRAELAAHLLTPVETLIQWEIGRHRTPGLAVAAVELLCENEGLPIPTVIEDVNS
jgi:DNA-binding transcriptional regulator YiaG